VALHQVAQDRIAPRQHPPRPRIIDAQVHRLLEFGGKRHLGTQLHLAR
jgi:hypothetical protein